MTTSGGFGKDMAATALRWAGNKDGGMGQGQKTSNLGNHLDTLFLKPASAQLPLPV